MGVVGSLTAQVAPSLVFLLFAIKGTESVLSIVGVTMLVVMPVCVFLTVTRVPETRDFVPSMMPVGRGIRLMLDNGPFKRLAITFLISSTGLAMTMPLYLFFIAYVLDAAQGAVNGPDELFGLRFLFALFPSLFYLASGAIVWSYPITEARHKAMRAEIEAARP